VIRSADNIDGSLTVTGMVESHGVATAVAVMGET